MSPFIIFSCKHGKFRLHRINNSISTLNFIVIALLLDFRISSDLWNFMRKVEGSLIKKKKDVHRNLKAKNGYLGHVLLITCSQFYRNDYSQMQKNKWVIYKSSLDKNRNSWKLSATPLEFSAELKIWLILKKWIIIEILGYINSMDFLI